MDEEKTNQEPEGTTENIGTGSKPATTSLITQADLAAERLEKALKMERENLKMREALMVRDALGGRADAGGQALEKRALTDKEYAEAMEKGLVNPMREDGFK